MKPTSPSRGRDLSASSPHLAEVKCLTPLGLRFPVSQQKLMRHRPAVSRRVASRRGPHPKPWMEPGSVTLCGEREDVTAIKLRSWRWGDGPGSTGGPNVTTRVLITGRQVHGVAESQAWLSSCHSRGSESEMKDTRWQTLRLECRKARSQGRREPPPAPSPPKLGKAKEGTLPAGTWPCCPLGVSPLRSIWTFDPPKTVR